MLANDKNIVTIERTPNEIIRVALVEYNRKTVLSIRIWVKKYDETWIPTKRGINLYPHELEDIEQAIDDVICDLEQ